jgi:parallel beta-helix repeat protein
MIVTFAFAVPVNWLEVADFTGTVSEPPPHTWIVDDDGPAHYRKIQDAINAANPGDVIYVKAGTYSEDITIDKPLSLTGENSDITIINGSGNREVVIISANNVNLNGFTVKGKGGLLGGWTGIWVHDDLSNLWIHNNIIIYHGAGIELEENTSQIYIYKNNVSKCLFGIYIDGAANIRINDNIISQNKYGIDLSGSTYITLINNSLTSHRVGMFIPLDGYAIRLFHSNYNIVYNNSISDNWEGIFVWNSLNNTIENNNITDNLGSGIVLSGSNNTLIKNNNIVDNGYIQVPPYPGLIYGAGIEIRGSTNNKIWHNNFIQNTPQIDIDDTPNIWDDGYPSGGNYWSDYTGVDEYAGLNQDKLGSDGIGDTPYVINENNQDNYPLMEPWTPQDVIQPITFDDYDGLWHTADFTITLTAYDVWSGIKETYYRINGGDVQNLSTHGHPLITTESENNTLEYWSVDKAGIEELPHNFLTGIKLDKTPPSGYVVINEGNEYTTSPSVSLTLTANDKTSGIHQVRFSNDGVWDTEPWEDFSATKTWTLITGDGTKTVYYQVRDVAGLLSSTYSDTIILDTIEPTGSIIINADTSYTNSTSVTLTLTATDETSGVAQMRFSNNGIDWSGWEPYDLTKSWTLLTGDGTKTVYAQFMDNAGLISQT